MSVALSTIEQSRWEIFLIPLLPLFGAAVLWLISGAGRRLHVLVGPIATLAAVSSFAVVVGLFFQLSLLEGVLVAKAWNWFEIAGVAVDVAFRFDNLSSVMALVVTGVGSLIHLYAIGYMAEDENRPRFFCYLNLFLFAMLILVLADNLLLMFIGWEGVGLCSYLLIGFWFKDMNNAKAGQKAFVVNRIGDAGFILGVFCLILFAKSLNFVEINSVARSLDGNIVSIIAFLLFVGAVGKSAQIPLFVWLPDAMAGPTPVSALIHAATMVTAGVYLLTRLAGLFLSAPGVLALILVLGTFTALFAASIALVQTDIKRVLAYSTVSQLGYMFMALGAGAFSNGIYHVVTHAFFKACLFMGAGSVIVGCHHEQDMRHFGGLWRKMPVTFLTYLVATLAISGIPFFVGFYSKDQILWTVFSAQSQLFGVEVGVACWFVGLFTAFLTAFYMTRSVAMTFFGKYRGHAHPHESPFTMTLPLIVLALLSTAIFNGEILMHYLEAWTRPDMRGGHEHLAGNHAYRDLERISIIVALCGVFVSGFIYTTMPWFPKWIAKWLPSVYRALCNKWYVDEIYASIVVRPLRGVARLLFSAVDRTLIDGMLVEGSALCVEANGEALRRMQTGQVRFYALVMFLCTFLFILAFLLF
ncbi:MAG: NADH-quinone oxidoreductase subunit L [Deltaproteobacteria bacterium]|nr:NADH-quinone oxidoreductase subunit L [Deltaproteobacteria bacterium]